jgi:hypothetical protein
VARPARQYFTGGGGWRKDDETHAKAQRPKERICVLAFSFRTLHSSLGFSVSRPPPFANLAGPRPRIPTPAIQRHFQVQGFKFKVKGQKGCFKACPPGLRAGPLFPPPAIFYHPSVPSFPVPEAARTGGLNRPKSGTAPDRPDHRPRLAKPTGAVPDYVRASGRGGGESLLPR